MSFPYNSIWIIGTFKTHGVKENKEGLKLAVHGLLGEATILEEILWIQTN